MGLSCALARHRAPTSPDPFLLRGHHETPPPPACRVRGSACDTVYDCRCRADLQQRPPLRMGEGRNGQSYRLEHDGNLSCYSEDGVNCKTGGPSTDLVAHRPLTCGAAHLQHWSLTGYDTADHWCNTAHANLFAQWQDHTLLGHPGMLAKNARGDTMCLSYDGLQCERIEAPMALDLKAAHFHDSHAHPSAPTGGNIRPLVCGAPHAQRYGHRGYDAPGHWCDTPEIVARWLHPDPGDTYALSDYRLAIPPWAVFPPAGVGGEHLRTCGRTHERRRVRGGPLACRPAELVARWGTRRDCARRPGMGSPLNQAAKPISMTGALRTFFVWADMHEAPSWKVQLLLDELVMGKRRVRPRD
ncbi:hypothetical protein Ddc_23906 [Ditylenchus destructor]|nr:hypothetical protein Ddc_23906 [Ditylenchus destructor]